jgi:hypothetical protein
MLENKISGPGIFLLCDISADRLQLEGCAGDDNQL